MDYETNVDEKPGYYAIIPASVRYDEELKANEKLLYGEITSLCNRDGHCWASNSYFANLYNVTSKAVSSWVSHLSELGYIRVSLIYKEGTKQIDKRVITLACESVGMEQNFMGYGTKLLGGMEQKVKENNTSINKKNSISKDILQEKKTIKRFSPPTLEEVREYCSSRNNGIDPEYFIDYYAARNWELTKGRKVKDWKACVRTWERNNLNKQKANKPGIEINPKQREGMIDVVDWGM